MSKTYAQQAILQATQKKQNCNLVQERKYDDYGDYGDVHGDYYDLDVSEYESLDDGNYSEVHGDYYDMDMPAESVAEKPMPNILERIKNRLFQKTK